MASDLKTYLRKLERSGYDVELRHGGHYAIRDNGEVVTMTGSTPNKGKRALLNLRARIKRHERGKQMDDLVGTRRITDPDGSVVYLDDEDRVISPEDLAGATRYEDAGGGVAYVAESGYVVATVLS
jgi:hypothetical protein